MPVLGEMHKEKGAGIKTDATECAVSGKPVEGRHSVRHVIPGTRFFYRVLSNQYHLLTVARVDELTAEANKASAPARSGKPEKEVKDNG